MHCVPLFVKVLRTRLSDRGPSNLQTAQASQLCRLLCDDRHDVLDLGAEVAEIKCLKKVAFCTRPIT